MKKKTISTREMRKLSILLLLIMFAGTMSAGANVRETKIVRAESQKKVKPAKLSKKNKKARKAYRELLAKKKFKRTEYNKFTYALIDLDSDGIDELLIDSGGNCMANMYYLLYTFKAGKVKELLCVCRVPLIVYEDGTLEYCMGHMSSVENSYYKMKNGTLHKRMQMYGLWPDSISKKQKKKAEYAAGMYWTTKRIGKKKVSYDDCQKWMKKFTASHKKIKVKYYKNTAKNRKSM